MKKRGFTLIELIMVITVLAIISVIAVPRALGTIEASKKESLTAIAKSAISTAKLYISTSQTISLPESGNATLITFSNLDLNYNKTPYGDAIDSANSYVFVDSTGNYYVTIATSIGKKGLKNISEDAFKNDNYVVIRYESDDTNNLDLPVVGELINVNLDIDGDGDLTDDGTLIVNFVEPGSY